MNNKKKLTTGLLAVLLVLALVFVLRPGSQQQADNAPAAQTEEAQESGQTADDAAGDAQEEPTEQVYTPGSEEEAAPAIDEYGSYTSKDDVALYIHTFGHLPSNFITKDEARSLGWESKRGNLGEVAPGMSIGGDHFGNYEGNLPKEKGREYYECDIDFDGGYRGEKRIIFSNDGLIFYTDDHYNTFEQLY